MPTVAALYEGAHGTGFLLRTLKEDSDNPKRMSKTLWVDLCFKRLAYFGAQMTTET